MRHSTKIIRFVGIIILIVGVIFVVGTIGRADHDEEMHRTEDYVSLTDQELFHQLGTGLKIVLAGVVTFGVSFVTDWVFDIADRHLKFDPEDDDETEIYPDEKEKDDKK